MVALGDIVWGCDLDHDRVLALRKGKISCAVISGKIAGIQPHLARGGLVRGRPIHRDRGSLARHCGAESADINLARPIPPRDRGNGRGIIE